MYKKFICKDFCNPIFSRKEEELRDEEKDDPSAMPVPQVKVGPDGQLILDEQSLVIEQTAVKRSREMLSHEIIVEDNDYGSGFYKKRQKSKEWPKWETFKFYKALNVVGTDFLLMQTVFPNRTRQEIKQKFKKEERVNRLLVEKTLKYHQEFDTEILKEQLGIIFYTLIKISVITNFFTFYLISCFAFSNIKRTRKHSSRYG